MGKKILSGIFWVYAVVALVGAIGNGSLFSDQGSAAATYGYFLGTVLPIVLLILEGIFLIGFDKPTKMNYIDGFKKRSKQTANLTVLMIVNALFFLVICLASPATADRLFGEVNVFTVLLVNLISDPFLLGNFVFITMWQAYVLPHSVSKKYFANSDGALYAYLSANETFYTYTEDNFVLASDKALYFPTLFCLIPFGQIASVKLYKNPLEQGIYINLINGKKIYIPTKHSVRIQEVVNANIAQGNVSF